MTMDTLTPAAQAAMADYRLYRKSLDDEAKQADASQRPLLARKLRHRAKIVARARLAEEFDPQPSGLGTFE